MLRAVLSGNPFNIIGWFAFDSTYQEFQKLWGGAHWMFPTPECFKDQVLVTLKNGNRYTANDLVKLFQDIKEDQVAAAYRDNILARKYTEFSFPDVPTYCIHGRNISAEYGLTYHKSQSQLGDPSFVDEPAPGGDGIGTYNSLSMCTEWKSAAEQSGKTFEHKVFDKWEHTSILFAPDYRNFVLNIVAPPIPIE